MLKPQELVILLKIVALGGRFHSYQQLSDELFISTSEIERSLKRAAKAHLYNDEARRPVISNLREFLIHGVRYAFPAEAGGMTRGMPTSYAAPPLNAHFDTAAPDARSHPPPAQQPYPVWPYAPGTSTGYALSPLYESVPRAAARDQKLYELLTLVDALREGRARERNIASEELKRRLVHD